MRNLKYLTLVLVSMFCFACGSDDDGGPTNNCNTSFGLEFQVEAQAVSDAASAYGSNQSAENCTNLKNAYQSYFNALEGWESCAQAANQLTEWRAALDAAQASINDIC